MTQLPKNEHVFDFKETGETTGKSYEGQFTSLCVLNISQKHNMEIERTRLQADFSNPTSGLNGIALILANLRVRILDAPEWWKQSAGGGDLLDENVLVALYDKVMNGEVVWREKLTQKADEIKAEPKSQDQAKKPSIIESIQTIAHYYAFSNIDSEEKLEYFLRSWWSRLYNKPLKDPILLSYTLEELLYEYYDRKERDKAEIEKRSSEDDRIEEEKQKQALDWAEQEELKELEKIKAAKAAQDAALGDDTKWMEEEMEKAKAMYGPDFGKDINEDFK